MVLFSESLGKACIGARRLPGLFRFGLTASNGPSWWNTVNYVRSRPKRPKGETHTSSAIDTGCIQLVDNVELAIDWLLIFALAVSTFSLSSLEVACLLFLLCRRFSRLQDRRLRVPTRTSLGSSLRRASDVGVTIRLHLSSAQSLLLRARRAVVRRRSSSARRRHIFPAWRGRTTATWGQSASVWSRRWRLVVNCQRTLPACVSIYHDEESVGFCAMPL